MPITHRPKGVVTDPAYSRSAAVYDLIYKQMKDYGAEADRIHALVQEHKRSAGNRLLDVACGTGLHLIYLWKAYGSWGLDLSLEQLKIASARWELPGVGVPHIEGGWFPKPSFIQGEMRTFRLKERFDVVTCLFSAIGHMQTEAELDQAVANMARHLVPGGVLIVEPWIGPDQWEERATHLAVAEGAGAKVARYSRSGRIGNTAILNMTYAVQRDGEPAETFAERFRLGLFTHDQYLASFERAGLETTHDPVGLVNRRGQGRGLYVGVKPL